MIGTLRAEFRKILTVRSTYGTALIAFLFGVVLMSFWIFGYKDAFAAAKSPEALQNSLFQVINFIGFFVSFIALLSVGHEYRYNTILYSLTATNRRGRMLFSKFIATNVVALVLATVLSLLGYAAFVLGQNMANINAVAQITPELDYLWRFVVVIVGTVSLAFVIASIVRSQILAIAAFLFLPLLIEGLLMLLLKENVKYLPFTAIGNILTDNPPLAYGQSALIVGAYVIGLGAVAWALFARRDAN